MVRLWWPPLETGAATAVSQARPGNVWATSGERSGTRKRTDIDGCAVDSGWSAAS